MENDFIISDYALLPVVKVE